MTTPLMFGFPLWKGRIKRRVAKKYIRFFGNAWFMRSAVQAKFARLGLGDFVNDCSGMNGRLLEIHPVYRRVASGRGSVLLNVDLQTTNTGCSLCGCGIEPKLSRDEVERRKVEFAKSWALDDSGLPGTAKYWYGSNVAAYEKTVEHSKKLVTEIESGGHVVDEDGLWLPGWAPESRV